MAFSYNMNDNRPSKGSFSSGSIRIRFIPSRFERRFIAVYRSQGAGVRPSPFQTSKKKLTMPLSCKKIFKHSPFPKNFGMSLPWKFTLNRFRFGMFSARKTYI